jgi:hypothetical protein
MTDYQSKSIILIDPILWFDFFLVKTNKFEFDFPSDPFAREE